LLLALTALFFGHPIGRLYFSRQTQFFRVERLQDLIDFVVGRILDQLGLPQKVMPRWGESSEC